MSEGWSGEVAFILAGGPSVGKLDLSPLAGRRVIVINSAWRTFPAATVLFYADDRWWRELGKTALGDKGEKWGGEIVTTATARAPRAALRVKVEPESGLSSVSNEVALKHSSVTGAINESVHRGAKRIIVLGLDGVLGPKGERHHHGEKYRWELAKKSFDLHNVEFCKIVPWLRQRGIQVINANPVSKITAWPRMSFEEALNMVSGAQSEPQATTPPSYAYRKDRDAIWRGNAPEKYTRLLRHIPSGPVVELGAAEGVLSLLISERGDDVRALEMRPARHEEALRLKARWLELGRNVERCHMELGDIRERLSLLDGSETLVAIRAIYYLRDDAVSVLTEAAKRGVENLVLCGNRNRAARFAAWRGKIPPNDGLGKFNRYASIEGMKWLLESAGYQPTVAVSDGDAIVTGRRS